MYASTDREKTLVKEALDNFALDMFIVLSGSEVELDPISLDKVNRIIAAAAASKLSNANEN